MWECVTSPVCVQPPSGLCNSHHTGPPSRTATHTSTIGRGYSPPHPPPSPSPMAAPIASSTPPPTPTRPDLPRPAQAAVVPKWRDSDCPPPPSPPPTPAPLPALTCAGRHPARPGRRRPPVKSRPLDPAAATTMLTKFSYSSADVRRVKRVQFGVLSPDDIVRAAGGTRARTLQTAWHASPARLPCAHATPPGREL
jgi:hypothetical protein